MGGTVDPGWNKGKDKNNFFLPVIAEVAGTESTVYLPSSEMFLPWGLEELASPGGAVPMEKGILVLVVEITEIDDIPVTKT